MTLTKTDYAPRAIDRMAQHWADIIDIHEEAPGVSTYWLQFVDEQVRESFSFLPGQFNMLYVPGYGEAAISISSDPNDTSLIGHTVRLAGNVTNALDRLKIGDTIGIRGPFGSAWPIDEHIGKDIYIAAGGIGLPPLRPMIYHIIKNREKFGKVVILYGARTPQDLQFTNEYDSWRAADIELIVTVDRADEHWQGLVGVVPLMFYRLRMDPKESVTFTCGPEIMIRFVVFEALARRVSEANIYVSLERNMKCGFGSCGHCQLGPFFVCKEGPVFTYQQLQPYFNVEEF